MVKAQFTNGDFSLGTNGCNAGTGWTTNTGTMSAQRTETYQTGDPWIDLTHCNGWGNGTWIEQAVQVVTGNCYRIDFDLSSHCGWDGSRAGVYITIDGQALGGWISVDTIRCPPPLYWERKSSLIFVAQNNPTIVRFTGEGRCRDTRTGAYPCSGPGAIGNPGVIALDNIELVPSGLSVAVSLGNDTVYCDTFTRTLDAGNAGSGTSYLWNTGATTRTINVSTPGQYSVTVNTACGRASDTINIAQGVMPDAGLGGDTTGCTGMPLILQPHVTPPSGVQYNWSTSATTPSVQVTQPGTYWVEMDVNGCIDRDTITVSFIDIRVDLGADRSLCDRDTPLILTSPYSSAYHHLWSNGLSDTLMHITRSGSYWLEVSRSRCMDSDTINVDLVATPDVYIGADSIICEQLPYRIGMEISDAHYRWSTGEATPYIEVKSTGQYVLEVSLRGCTVYDTVSITAMPAPDIYLGGDRDICPDKTIILNAVYGTGSTYSWSTGESSADIAVTKPGIYGVRVVTAYHCIGGDTVTLNHYPLPDILLGPDTTVCEETPLLLLPFSINADSIRWSDGSTGSNLRISYGGTYVATGINKCGAVSDTIVVQQIFCNIWVPNVFTPNGDGKNDVFRALGNLGRVEQFGLSIYNRWGERVFHTQNQYKGWDGQYKGADALLGSYSYLLEYSFEGKPYQQKGSFHLLR